MTDEKDVKPEDFKDCAVDTATGLHIIEDEGTMWKGCDGHWRFREPVVTIP